MTDLSEEWAKFQLTLWKDVLVSSLSGAAVVGTEATKHLVGAAEEIADVALARFQAKYQEGLDE